jgi:hypothetical protein
MRGAAVLLPGLRPIRRGPAVLSAANDLRSFRPKRPSGSFRAEKTGHGPFIYGARRPLIYNLVA